MLLAPTPTIQRVSATEIPSCKQEDNKGSEEGEHEKTSYDFDDQSTWSDNSAHHDDDNGEKEEGDNTSIFNTTTEGECNDDTIREYSPSPCSSPEIQAHPPPKRIVSKRRDRPNDSIAQVRFTNHFPCSDYEYSV